MHENVIPAGCGQVLTFKKLKKLMETPPQVDRNRTPPPCRICPFYQPSFRYRKCLYVVCPYGKNGRAAFRRKPLKKDIVRMGGGEMRV